MAAKSHLCEHRLSAPWRTIQQNTLRRAEETCRRFKDLRVAQRKDDGFAELRDDRIQAANVCRCTEVEGSAWGLLA